MKAQDRMDPYLLLEAMSAPAFQYVLELLQANVRAVHFVQVGACDGITDDPIHSLVVRHGWTGVCVEPVPEQFRKLGATYAGRANVQLMPVCCSSNTASRPFYTLRPGADIFSQFLSSFDKQVLLAHRALVPDIEERIEEISVETLTLDQIVARSRLPKLDLLCVDAEGTDDDVIQSLNLLVTRPQVIFFEHKHIPYHRLLALDEFLTVYGYTCIRLYADSIYVAEPLSRFGRIPRMAAGYREIFAI